VRSVLRDLDAFCQSSGHRTPARATVYKFLARCDGHIYLAADLPEAVRRALYNLAPDAEVPGHQLAFYCFNYGGLEAISFASGLPWLDLYQAARVRGWRPKSLGLLKAAMRVRGI
jgi:hypothetical protein